MANGEVYVGVASLCDNPLTQGILDALNETTGVIHAQADIVPNEASAAVSGMRPQSTRQPVR